MRRETAIPSSQVAYSTAVVVLSQAANLESHTCILQATSAPGAWPNEGLAAGRCRSCRCTTVRTRTWGKTWRPCSPPWPSCPTRKCDGCTLVCPPAPPHTHSPACPPTRSTQRRHSLTHGTLHAQCPKAVPRAHMHSFTHPGPLLLFWTKSAATTVLSAPAHPAAVHAPTTPSFASRSPCARAPARVRSAVTAPAVPKPWHPFRRAGPRSSRDPSRMLTGAGAMRGRAHPGQRAGVAASAALLPGRHLHCASHLRGPRHGSGGRRLLRCLPHCSL